MHPPSKKTCFVCGTAADPEDYSVDYDERLEKLDFKKVDGRTVCKFCRPSLEPNEIGMIVCFDMRGRSGKGKQVQPYWVR